jgi:hypothetical protein
MRRLGAGEDVENTVGRGSVVLLVGNDNPVKTAQMALPFLNPAKYWVVGGVMEGRSFVSREDLEDLSKLPEAAEARGRALAERLVSNVYSPLHQLVSGVSVTMHYAAAPTQYLLTPVQSLLCVLDLHSQKRQAEAAGEAAADGTEAAAAAAAQ